MSDNAGDLLAAAVAREARFGWRVEALTDTTAIFGKGRNVSHTLHFILTFLTFGAWIPVWVGLWMVFRRRTVTVTVDEAGHLTRVEG